MINRKLLVLARSKKNGNYCVAGKCIETKEWIRPVSNLSGGALSINHIMYNDNEGRFIISPRQIIEFSLTRQTPLINQPENYLINTIISKQEGPYLNSNEITNYLDNPKNLWGPGDRVNYSKIVNKLTTINQSLYLIKANNVTLYKGYRKQYRAKFIYNGISYDLAVTDKQAEEFYNENKSSSRVICISLGEEYNGACYKLVAAIL